ncbi:MAG: response regulator transcription factor [Chloroflexota bacterium]|jgi:DNA-binding NarL/FixJ family response regulator
MKKRIRLLIVDDQEPIRRGLRALLALYPELELVGEAADGLEAIRMARESQPDVILMDMQMPVIDGLEATRRIKDRWSEIKIVALTFYQKYRAPAISAGVDGFLLKGCATKTLMDTIMDLRNSPTPELTGESDHSSAEAIRRTTEPDDYEV